MTEIGNPAFFYQQEKMIMMVTTHSFFPSTKLKSFKEAIGNVNSYLEHHDHMKEVRE